MKKVLGVALGAGILLAACGSDGSPAANQKEVKFGEIMNKGKQVSFIVNNEDGLDKPSDDNKITKYIVSKNGKYTAYQSDRNTRFGEVKDKSFDEIVKMAKDQDKQFFDKEKNNEIYDLERFRDNFLEEFSGAKVERKIKRVNENVKELKKEKYKEPDTKDLKIEVETGDNNKEPKLERFYMGARYFKDDFDKSDTGKVKYMNTADELKNLNNTFTDGAYTMSEGDNTFAYLKNLDDNDNFLVTKVGEKAEKSVLDEPNSKYVKKVKE
ncbi:hypothetical protein [Staphylococcus hominis]|uniref:hypothetical protein n=1 Tax=Staphylococcus hominis TaxID=1290 RepID=UPI00287ABE8B|nr:hypothetical protein [Staphylococcus hominis]MDS3884625.1 hypothetical protein [Staphylococcus hominis]MDS3884771.1 hypothetical protein [Staphylococcus hominis]